MILPRYFTKFTMHKIHDAQNSLHSTFQNLTLNRRIVRRQRHRWRGWRWRLVHSITQFSRQRRNLRWRRRWFFIGRKRRSLVVDILIILGGRRRWSIVIIIVSSSSVTSSFLRRCIRRTFAALLLFLLPQIFHFHVRGRRVDGTAETGSAHRRLG